MADFWPASTCSRGFRPTPFTTWSRLKLQSNSFRLEGLGYIYARAARKSDALGLRCMLNEHSRSYILPYHIGVVYLGLGDLDQAFSSFEIGV